MTMPYTATAVTQLELDGPAALGALSNEQLELLEKSLESDLPGAVPFIMEAAAKSADAGGDFAWLSRSPEETGSKEDWGVLVGYLARLFASPYRDLAQALARRRYGVEVAFVNCCIVAAQQGGVDGAQLFRLQTSQQMTPDC